MRAGSIFYPIAEIFGVGALCLLIPLGVMFLVCWWSRKELRAAANQRGENAVRGSGHRTETSNIAHCKGVK